MKSVSLFGVVLLTLLNACSPNRAGDGDGDADSGPVECDPGRISCSEGAARLCNDTGDGWAEVEVCADPTPTCSNTLGCVVCHPGSGMCDGDVPRICNSDGSEWNTGEACDISAGQSCINGYCADPCAAAAESNSYVGCEYWAVDLPNAQQQSGLSPENANFAVVISNGHASASASVRVFTGGDDSTPILSVTVPPNDLRTLEINPSTPPSQTNIGGSGVHPGKAFRIVSNLPVTAYQFNPLNNTDEAYSNDASLLLPINGLDDRYIVATGDGIIGGDSETAATYNWGSFVSVIAVTDGTEVVVTPTQEIAAGGEIAGGTEPITVILDAYDVLNIESVAREEMVEGNANLSGTFVSSSAPVAVFSGNVATVVPAGPTSTCCADHLEEQMIPLSAWGQQFVAARGMARRNPEDLEPEYYRITGGNVPDGQDHISLTYQPRAPAGAPTQLREGESVEFSSTTDFIVEGNGPILVTSYFVSSFQTAQEIDTVSGMGVRSCSVDNDCVGLRYAAVCVSDPAYPLYGNCLPIGDPSMTMIPPIEQFRDSYVFLAPNDYAYDAVTVIAPMGAVITLDGAPLPELTLIGQINGENYGVVRTLIGDGTHRLESDGGVEVGLIVYGMDRDVSYGYPGGLDLEEINII